ncbi:cytochrome P450 [Glycomyces scopariae]
MKHPALPADRPADRPFDPPAALALLRERSPLSRMTYPDGHVGWLATGHALVREVLADPRFSARSDRYHQPFPGVPNAVRPAPPGMFGSMDEPGHGRYRRLLTGQFTVRRMRALTGHVEEVTAGLLDAMEQGGAPADVVRDLAVPLSSQVICELLGVPYADRERFQGPALRLFRMSDAPQERAAAFAAVHGFVSELVAAKRAAPTDDLLGGLVATDLTDEELVNIGFSLLGAGLDTTANMIALGAFALLEHPVQLAELRGDPGLAAPAVEELLRYLSVIPATVRAATEDVVLAGETVKAGESVTVSIPAANRDPARFADPDVLDLLRSTAGHVAFGHGVHQCLGQQLARVELQVAVPALLSRFPGLRLAVASEAVRMRTDMIIYGVHELPIEW